MKFLLFLFIIFFILPPFFRWAVRWFVTSQINKAQQEMSRRSRQKTTEDGKVVITPQERYKGGEFVDYEEVKD